MASNNQAPAVVVMALILFAAANPLSHALQDLPTTLLSGINVSGRLCCTANGSCSTGAAGLGGVRVSLVCSNNLGVAVTVGQSTTGPSGAFILGNLNLVPLLGGLLNVLTPLPCTAFVQLPLSQATCPVLSAVNGILAGVLSTTTSVATVEGVLVADLSVIRFVYVGSVSV